MGARHDASLPGHKDLMVFGYLPNVSSQTLGDDLKMASGLRLLLPRLLLCDRLVKEGVHRGEALVHRVKASVYLGELAAQEFNELLVLAISHAGG